MKSILFVCLGNICRSPAAEAIMVELFSKQDANSRYRCSSAGTIDYHQGEPPDLRMLAALKRRGYHHQSPSRPVCRQDFYDYDLIIAMDYKNLADLQRRCPEAELISKIKLMCDYCRTHELKEVPDPYYGGAEGFETVITLIEDACQGLWHSLEQS